VALSTTAISIIGRRHPEIFDLLGTPFGPLVRARADQAGLNPQPLPPLQIGMLAGQELIRVAFTATRLGIGFELDMDDWCPTPPRRPKFPPIPWPPIAWHSMPDLDLGWAQDYATGLALALEASTHLWEGLDTAGAISELHDLALRNAENDRG